MILRKFSEHGLGHLLNPLNPSDESTNWIKAMWEIIDNEAQGFPIQRPEWFGLPAVGRETASSPTLVQRLTPKKRKRLSYADRIKPMNFLLTAHVAPFGHPQGVDPKQFRLIAPFNTDSSKWLRMPWTDIHSGNIYAITNDPNADSRLVRVKSYGEVFTEYVTHPELKSAGRAGPCSRSDHGLLERQLIVGTRIIYIGKESNRLEEVENGTVQSWDEVQETYEDTRRDPFTLYVVPILKQIKCAELMQKTGCKERHIIAIRNGYRNPSITLRKALIEIAAEHARKFTSEPIGDDLDACAVYIRQIPRKIKELHVNDDNAALNLRYPFNLD
jgi:hypothetical protein